MSQSSRVGVGHRPIAACLFAFVLLRMDYVMAFSNHPRLGSYREASAPVGLSSSVASSQTLPKRVNLVKQLNHRGRSSSPSGVGVKLNAATTQTMDIESVEESKKDPLFEAPFKGIIRDYRRRLPLYKSDIVDGLNSQCLAATMFLFFACLAPAVGFGALYYSATNGAIGTIEMVASTALSGMFYALTSAQPLTIIGSTGPVLAFVATLYTFSQRLGLPFLPIYAWTGLWTSAILFVSAITSASSLVKYLTRFTDEIFSCLISAIFIIEAVTDVSKTFTSPATPLVKALLTLVCASATYGLSNLLKSIRNTAYGNKVVSLIESSTAIFYCVCLVVFISLNNIFHR